ncbi:unnamed protein product (macronuclear) [Paramecium tetraurelia]|uniref:Protein kinase domain-containing protein n=1 Tax=Paramecium tetraurelia TaxID=5888 RepID=A0BX10_PARTE|nr:uncharacterized protein GSPATT00032929001 [Paramecium tetraurelia]CAK63077.1 unnamed protein product [Paramecium tetraurelia]|eukprot:XP_001430475.1 hypothetical protein (macronuclear) [Paramecium tetraurelia strain d4-2]
MMSHYSDLEFLYGDNGAKNVQDLELIMQQEEAVSPNIFAVVIIHQLSNNIEQTISRNDVIAAIEQIIKRKFQGEMVINMSNKQKQVRSIDVKIEPILSTSVKKACCLIQVEESIIQQLKGNKMPLQFSDKDQDKELNAIFEVTFFEFNEFNQCNLLRNGKFAKEFAVIRPYQESQRLTSIILSINKMDQQIYAIKKVRITGEFTWQKLYYNKITQIREVKAMLRLQHPNVIRLYSWWIEEEIRERNNKYIYLYQQLEYDSYLGCNNLLQFSLIHLSKASEKEKRKTMQSLIHQLISGLEYIHNQGFFHRDLKLENLLITQDDAGEMALRICDFDWSISHQNDDGQNNNQLIFSKYYGTTELKVGLQRREIVYDAREELFQVGIIILDLCDPTFTKEERIQIQMNATNKPQILQNYKLELQIIQALLRKDFQSVQKFRTSQLYNQYMQM